MQPVLLKTKLVEEFGVNFANNKNKIQSFPSQGRHISWYTNKVNRHHTTSGKERGISDPCNRLHLIFTLNDA